MAIAFAYPRFISRSKGQNVVHVAAYNMRDQLFCERTGEQTPLRGNPTTHVYHEILLPDGASGRFTDPETLWNAVQAAERRKDSQEAFEVVLPLPAELTSADRIAIAVAFAVEHFSAKGLGVQIDVHTPNPPNPNLMRLYRGEGEGNVENGGWFTTDYEKAALYGAVSYIDVSRADLLHFAQGHGGVDEWLTDDAEIRARPRQVINHHAHLIATTRRIEGDRLSSHKAADLFPKVRRLRYGKVIVAEGELWGALWRDFQNKWFSENGKSITVDPTAPIPGEHIGRSRHPKDVRLETAEQARQLNAKIARNPDAVAQHLGRHPFDARALSRFLSKHIVDPKERDEVQAEVHDKINQLKRAALEKGSWSDKVQSGLRPLSVEDIARELSPAYAALVSKANDLREAARKAEWIQNRQVADKEAGQHRVAERWAEMGVARRLLHLTGAWGDVKFPWRDAEIDRWSNLAKRGEYGEAKYAIRGAAYAGGKLGAPTGEIQIIARRAEIELDKMRPSGLSLRQEAELELRQRRRIAENARAALETLNLSDRRALRASRSR